MFKKSGKDAWSVVKRGNMFMLAIGLLLGSLFGAVVTSLAQDVILASINKALHIQKGQEGIGKFLSALFSFLVVATIIFFTLWIVFYLRNLWLRHKESKSPTQTPEVKPTNEELILAELKKLNENIVQRK